MRSGFSEQLPIDAVTLAITRIPRMWKIHSVVLIPACILLLVGLSGASWISGGFLDRWFGDLDIWLQGGLSYPTLAALALGFLFAYAVFGLLLLTKYFSLMRWLVRLSDLWTDGVAAHADGLALATDAQVTAWVERRYVGWHNRVVDALETVSPQEALYFAATTSGTATESDGSSNAGSAYRSAFHRTNVQAMSLELAKLRTIIDRQHGRLNPVVAAFVIRLQGLQGQTFGHIPRAREFTDTGER